LFCAKAPIASDVVWATRYMYGHNAVIKYPTSHYHL
jgi:hypothetical protein